MLDGRGDRFDREALVEAQELLVGVGVVDGHSNPGLRERLDDDRVVPVDLHHPLGADITVRVEPLDTDPVRRRRCPRRVRVAVRHEHHHRVESGHVVMGVRIGMGPYTEVRGEVLGANVEEFDPVDQ